MSQKSLVARRFTRSAATYNDAAVIQRAMATRLVQSMLRADESPHWSHVLELGCGTGLFTEMLLRECTIEHLALNDISDVLTSAVERCRRGWPAVHVRRLPGDMETIPLPSSQDLVVSSAALQWASQPARMLERMVNATRPGGLVAVATFGPRNLEQLHEWTGNSLHYLPLSDLEIRLAARAEILDRQQRVETVHFDSAYRILQHLKQTGANSLQQPIWSPRAVKEFCHQYEAQFRGSRGVPLTYHPMIIVARRHADA